MPVPMGHGPMGSVPRGYVPIGVPMPVPMGPVRVIVPVVGIRVVMAVGMPVVRIPVVRPWVSGLSLSGVLIAWRLDLFGVPTESAS